MSSSGFSLKCSILVTSTSTRRSMSLEESKWRGEKVIRRKGKLAGSSETAVQNRRIKWQGMSKKDRAADPELHVSMITYRRYLYMLTSFQESIVALYKLNKEKLKKTPAIMARIRV